jgi:hypothetical protein
MREEKAQYYGNEQDDKDIGKNEESFDRKHGKKTSADIELNLYNPDYFFVTAVTPEALFSVADSLEIIYCCFIDNGRLLGRSVK